MHRTVEVSTYADPKVKRLPSDGKFRFVYLVTNEMTHVCGLYHAPYVLVASQMGIGEKRVKDMLDELDKQRLVLHDDETEVVWVVNMLKHQLHSSKIKVQILKHLKSIHAPVLVKSFLLHYADKFHRVEGYQDMLDRYQDIHIDQTGYTYPGDQIYISGNGDMQNQKTGYVSVPDSVPDSVSNPDTEKNQKIETTTTDSGSLPRLRRFSDRAQNLIDLWNEIVAPVGLPRVGNVPESVERKIFAAYKMFPERDDWLQILGEYPRSLFLQNKRGGEGIKKDFVWLLSKGFEDKVENYVKVQSGRYRDKEPSAFSEKEQKNLNAAQRVLERRRMRALAEGNGDVHSSTAGDVLDGVVQAGDGEGGGGHGGEDGYLPGGSGGLALRESDRGDPLVSEEYESLPTDF